MTVPTARDVTLAPAAVLNDTIAAFASNALKTKTSDIKHLEVQNQSSGQCCVVCKLGTTPQTKGAYMAAISQTHHQERQDAHTCMLQWQRSHFNLLTACLAWSDHQFPTRFRYNNADSVCAVLVECSAQPKNATTGYKRGRFAIGTDTIGSGPCLCTQW